MSKGKRNVRQRTKVKKNETVEEESLKLQDRIFVVFCILMFFLAFYLLTLYITHKNSDTKENDTTEETSFSYDEIIFGRSLSMDQKEYMVIFYDNNNEEVASSCRELVSNYRSNHSDSLYFVDMGIAFNSQYVTEEETNKSPESIQDLRINGPTVIKVVDKKVVEYVEGLDNVTNYLQ